MEYEYGLRIVKVALQDEHLYHLDCSVFPITYDQTIVCAEMFEEELDYRIKRLTAFLEPAMIVFVGLIVGFIAVTLISSIYSLAGGFK